MNQKEILKKLEKDENYYGKFGKQYLSNSDISTLLKNPLALHTPQKKNTSESSWRLFSYCNTRK